MHITDTKFCLLVYTCTLYMHMYIYIRFYIPASSCFTNTDTHMATIATTTTNPATTPPAMAPALAAPMEENSGSKK